MKATPTKVDESASSSFYEQLVEHTFIAELLQEACFRYHDTIEVLHSEVDAYGYDLVLVFRGVVRFVQLKTSKPGATTTSQKVSLRLAERLGGCVVWAERTESEAYRITLKYRFLGTAADESLEEAFALKNSAGIAVYKTARHTKGNKDGHKAERPEHRVVPKTAFTNRGELLSMQELFLMLFDQETMLFDDLLFFIKDQALMYRMAEDESEYDMLELDTFRELLRFALNEGFQADATAISRVLCEEDGNEEEEENPDYTDWHYLDILLEAINEQIAKKELPAKTTFLYKTWLFESRDFDPNFWDKPA